MRKSLPLIRQLSKQSTSQLAQVRTLWDLDRPSRDFLQLFRDMDRRMDAFEREFFKIPPFRYLPRVLPIEGVKQGTDGKFRVDIDLSGFQPEDIKISLKDGKMKVEANIDRVDENGNRIIKKMLREFTIPAEVDDSTVESLFQNDILKIEGAYKMSEGEKIKIEGVKELEQSSKK